MELRSTWDSPSCEVRLAGSKQEKCAEGEEEVKTLSTEPLVRGIRD